MSDTTIDYQVLNEIVISLVSDPAKVVIHRKTDDMGVLLSIQVAVEDMGAVIGRNGIMADSIKTLMRAIGRTHGMNIRVKILEPEGSTRQRPAHTTSPRVVDEKKHTPEKDSTPAVDLDGELDEFVIS
jgi:uncharacterized protein